MNNHMDWPQAAVYIAEWFAVAWIFGGPLIKLASRRSDKDEK